MPLHGAAICKETYSVATCPPPQGWNDVEVGSSLPILLQPTSVAATAVHGDSESI